MKKILILEDDSTLLKTISLNLEKTGHIVKKADSVITAKNILNEKIDLALLDVNLRDGTGFDIAKEIKTIYPTTPIIFLTVRDLEEDILKGYSFGAIDYITKPFSIEILLQKINAIFTMISHDNKEFIFNDGNLEIDFNNFVSILENKKLLLTSMEYKVLEVFVKNEGQVLTREKLLQLLWDDDNNFVDEHALTATISRIRKKIESKKTYIKTLYGIGYVWQGKNL